MYVPNSAITHSFLGAQRVGLISDTHGLMRPEALDALRGSDLILHAGDVGKICYSRGLKADRSDCRH